MRVCEDIVGIKKAINQSLGQSHRPATPDAVLACLLMASEVNERE